MEGKSATTNKKSNTENSPHNKPDPKSLSKRSAIKEMVYSQQDNKKRQSEPMFISKRIKYADKTESISLRKSAVASLMQVNKIIKKTVCLLIN